MSDPLEAVGDQAPGAARSWVRWRDEAVIPSGYDDVAALARLARRARDRVVEFEWVFEGEDLRRLRSAVYHWSTGTVGRFTGVSSL